MDTGGRVLVVDDVADDRVLMQRFFARLGYDVLEAADGAAALKIIESEALDAVLLDVGLPDLDGVEILRRIRANAALAGLPVIMVTGRGADADVVAALENGATDHITKPLHLEVARARVAAHIARKRAEDASRAARADLEFTIAQLKSSIAETEAAMAARAEFLATISHEIRTPLNGILGIASVLTLEPLTPRQTEMVEVIQQSGGNLERLLSDLLDSERLEAGKLQLANEPFRLHDLVRRSAKLFEAAASKKGLALEIELDPAAPAELVGDPGRLQQIINNLIGNAVKFTETGRVLCRLKSEGANAYSIEVSDTGMGFEPRLAETLFERFKQADGGIAVRHGGTGLGLPISRDLARLMGGSLTASSEVGKGSLFRLVLPTNLVVAEEAAEGVEEAEPAEPTPIRVLVVDDNAVNRCVLELMLGPTGCEVVSAENGQEAVEAVDEHAFDLILMDLQMPVMDGLTAIAEIRKRDPGHPPIIVVSANGRPESVRDCLAAGAISYLNKPVNVGELLAAVSHAVAVGPAQAPSLAKAS